MRQKIASITQLLRLPAVCVLCKQYHRESHAVCAFCTTLLKPIGPACQCCAHPLTDDNFLFCGACIKKRPYFDKTITTYRFEDPLRSLLHQFKYEEALYLRSFLVKLMLDGQNLVDPATECLIPVPLHPLRIRQRGFNQAAELAKCLAKRLKIPCELQLCQKIIHTQAQASLNSQERRSNLQQAFRARSSHYKHITLVDDLLTTGSTANELAKTLKNQGIKQVDLWCCARVI